MPRRQPPPGMGARGTVGGQPLPRRRRRQPPGPHARHRRAGVHAEVFEVVEEVAHGAVGVRVDLAGFPVAVLFPGRRRLRGDSAVATLPLFRSTRADNSVPFAANPRSTRLVPFLLLPSTRLVPFLLLLPASSRRATTARADSLSGGFQSAAAAAVTNTYPPAADICAPSCACSLAVTAAALLLRASPPEGSSPNVSRSTDGSRPTDRKRVHQRVEEPPGVAARTPPPPCLRALGARPRRRGGRRSAPVGRGHPRRRRGRSSRPG